MINFTLLISIKVFHLELSSRTPDRQGRFFLELHRLISQSATH